MLSIFCPYRGRDFIFEDFIWFYSLMYPKATIYMIEQDDPDQFKRGQLANIAFNEIMRKQKPLENIAFIDIDLRPLVPIDFEEILKKNNTVTVPFDRIELYKFAGVGRYVPLDTPSYFLKGVQLTGGLTLFTRTLFEKCCGFSNVYIGWGCEDSDFILRNPNRKYEKNPLFHLEHHREVPKRIINRNSNILKFKRTNPLLDGYKQTKVERVEWVTLAERIFLCKVHNIGVVPGFQYMNYF
jgi:hypothetical protein